MKKQFKIPMIPPSINQTYKINYNTRQVYKAEEVTKFEYQCKLFTPNIQIEEETRLKTSIELHGNWLTKAGKIRRKDIQNMDKILIDSIFKKIGVDDSYIFDHHLRKMQSHKEFTLVTIETML